MMQSLERRFGSLRDMSAVKLYLVKVLVAPLSPTPMKKSEGTGLSPVHGRVRAGVCIAVYELVISRAWVHVSRFLLRRYVTVLYDYGSRNAINVRPSYPVIPETERGSWELRLRKKLERRC